MRNVIQAVCACLLTFSMGSAQQRDVAAYRDFESVQRLRVVCEHQHFGRIDDLVADVATGKLRTAIVSMDTEGGARAVAVPFDELTYDAQSNLLQLGPCLEEGGHHHPAFDASKIKVTVTKRDDETKVYGGSVLVSRLASSKLVLQGKDTGTVQGITIELVSGHVAFCHVATVQKQAGDRQLHPTPWAALQFQTPSKDPKSKAAIVGLTMTAAQLLATPSLLDVIVQDALYRPRIYEAFAVPAPPYDRS